MNLKYDHIYFTNCVDWPRWAIDELSDMIDTGREITRRTFVKNVDGFSRVGVERMLGYHDGFPIEKDYHVSYHKGKLNGQVVYWIRHSAIEYVFTMGGHYPKRRAA